nr:hypothetical protein [Fortiea contorta]
MIPTLLAAAICFILAFTVAPAVDGQSPIHRVQGNRVDSHATKRLNNRQ